MNENGKMGLNPNQLRPTNLPRGLQVEPAQVVSPGPDAGRSSGSRALRLLPYSYYPLLPSSKEPVPLVDSFSLTAAGQPRTRTGFPSFSLKKLREPARTAVYCGTRYLSTTILQLARQSTNRDARLNLSGKQPRYESHLHPAKEVESAPVQDLVMYIAT